jgi:hypothetical protein
MAELIVVCSGPGADGDRADVERLLAGHPLDPKVLVRADGGPGGARNAGIDAARAEQILFLNADTPPAGAGLVRGHLDALFERDDVWRAVLGHCSWDPSEEITPVMEWLARTGKSHDYEGLSSEGSRGATLYANNLSMRRAALEEVDGFDERFASYGWEEYDLALRLADRGLTVTYRPELLVWHRHRHDTGDSLRRMEQVGRAANLLNRVHADRDGLATPSPAGARAAIARALAPVAVRFPAPERLPRRLRDRVFRAQHYSALARGYAASPLPADPALRGGLAVRGEAS